MQIESNSARTAKRTKKPEKPELSPIAENDGATVPIVIDIPLAKITESPTNQRRTFKDLDELAATLAVHGVLQPVLVRPLPEGGSGYELVFGARRFRACAIAGLTHIPATVRELTDAQALELQLVENSKRDDVHPLEEADGYRELHETHGYPIEEIAAKVAKPETFVQQRLKLCALSESARAAFLDGKLTTATALLVARLTSAAHQDKAIKRILASTWNDDMGPLSARDVGDILQREFLLRLADASFDTADASLVPDVPACSQCTKNTGNQRSLFGELEIEAAGDLCTDRPCFEAKRAAGWAKAKSEAKAKGHTILPDKAAAKVFSYGGRLNHGSGYVDLAETTYANGKTKKNKTLIGKVDVPIVLARDELGGVHQLVAKADFAKAMKASGVLPAQTARSAIDASQKLARDREAKEREARRESIAELVGAAERHSGASDALWRALARAAVRASWAETQKTIARRREVLPKGENAEEVLLAEIAKMDGAKARGMCVEIAASAERGYEKRSLDELREVLVAGGKAKATKKRRRS